MQSFQPYGMLGSSPISLKRKSRSPSPASNKRRIPSTYTPSLYQPQPSRHPRSLSVEASGGSPISERSSPGIDWLQRTQDLQIHTPPIGLADRAMQGWNGAEGLEDVGMGDVGSHDAMMDDSSAPAYTPQPAVPLSSHSSHSQPCTHSAASSSNASTLSYVQSAPHDAPPLHHHLAGSPQTAAPMSRSSSSSSTHSMLSVSAPVSCPTYSVLSPPQKHFQEHPMHDALPTPLAAMDVPMPQSPLAKRHGQGWKVTMGYRPDCDKCQQRIPGHYSHVVYTN
ncbi:hypothetical protein JCM5296_005697 [Sporobolomyces johnsonii]